MKAVLNMIEIIADSKIGKFPSESFGCIYEGLGKNLLCMIYRLLSRSFIHDTLIAIFLVINSLFSSGGFVSLAVLIP